MVAHAFNSSTGETESGGSLSLKPVWSTKWIPEQPRLLRETLFLTSQPPPPWKKNQNPKQLKIIISAKIKPERFEVSDTFLKVSNEGAGAGSWGEVETGQDRTGQNECTLLNRSKQPALQCTMDWDLDAMKRVLSSLLGGPHLVLDGQEPLHHLESSQRHLGRAGVSLAAQQSPCRNLGLAKLKLECVYCIINVYYIAVR